MGADKQNQMLDLLDRAYSVPDDAEQFDAMLESAQIYFFDREAGDDLSPDLPRYSGLDPHIESHIDRIERLMDQAVSAPPKLGLALSHHAQMTVDDRGKVLSLNNVAQKLLQTQIVGYLSDLPLTHESLSALRELISDIRAGVDKVERILYIQTDMEPQTSVFAFCRAYVAEDDNLEDKREIQISFSQFDWSPALLEYLEKALGLSDSEGQVLHGILRGQSQSEIAEARGRSVETIKGQAKAILRKAGVSKMTELAHLCTSIAYVIGLSELAHPHQAKEQWVTPKQNLQTKRLKDGRRLAWYEFGDPNGKPVLYIHGFVYGPFFLDRMKQSLVQAGLRLICPSRPGFGYSDAETRGQNYDDVVVSDSLELMAHLGLRGSCLVAAHQGGGSHGFRIARALGERAKALMLIGAGIPITKQHMKYMDAQTRTIAAATRHAPSVLRMIAGLGVKTYRKRGMRAYLERYFKEHTVDYRSLEDPESYQKLAEGYYHLVEQDIDVFIRDGQAAMADWTSDFDGLNCPQYWLHGADCPVMSARYLKDYVQKKTNYPVEVLPDTGINILYQRPEIIVDRMIKLAFQE